MLKVHDFTFSSGRRGELPVCGNTRQPGPRGIPQLVITKGLRLEGIFVADHMPGARKPCES
jgi:hypothetical protein